MATKNYKQMSTKKLNALMETASDEEKALIQEVLNTRNAASAGAGANAPANELTDDEKAAIEAAEAENGAVVEEKKPAKEKAIKMTDEERIALAEKLRAEAVDHKCEVVPFNSIEWVNGVVVAIIEEKRNNKVMYAVKTEDGRRVVKAYGSNLIKILDETVERAKRTRGAHKSEKAEDADEPWTDEEIEEAIKEVIGNVGKTVSYPEAGAYGQIAENAATVTGRIVSLVPAKRSKTILYRIELDQDNPEAAKKYAHKVSTLDTLDIAEELDEVGQKINEAFTARRYKEPTEAKPAKNEKEAFDYATEMLAKAEAQLEKAKQLVEKREAALAKAKEAYDAALAEGKTFDEPTEEPTAEAEAEATEENADLM
jgi:phage baseplate assembly protein W